MSFSRSLFTAALLLGLCGATSGVGAQTAPTEYFIPTTDAEKALDQLLHRAVDDDNMINYLLRTPYYKAGNDETYAALFTHDFMNRMAAAEAEKVREECGGQYREHQICGFDYNPITCTEDTRLPGYFYRTNFASDNSNAVLLALGAHKDAYASYMMAKDNGVWRLDDVQCLADPSE